MRWSYIIPRVIIVLMLWSFLTWGLDPLLRYSAVESLQTITGARADIAVLETHLFPPRLNLQSVALASSAKPGRNLVQFDQLTFSLAGNPLLRKQFVVTEGTVTGVRFDTPRQDDGQLVQDPVSTVEEEPSWLTEQMTQLSDEWLNRLVDDVQAQLDPNTLATWRTGTAIYSKWDERFQSLSDRGRLLKPRFEQLRLQFENARRGDPVQRIEQYIQVAQRAELLTQEAQRLQQELTGIVPEVRADFSTLDQARRTDQEMIQAKLELLKPDARRISESLIGEEMYLQLQQLLSWVELAREYQENLHEQTQPERGRGTDFLFPLDHPHPDFLLERLQISGTFRLDGEDVPFEAVISDITEDAPLLRRPCVVSLLTGGPQPVTLEVVYDATQEIAVTNLHATWNDQEGRSLSAGKPEKAMVAARLADIGWNLDLTLREEQLNGQVALQSQFEEPVFSAGDSIRPEFVQAAMDVLAAIQTVNARVDIGGTLRQPQLNLQSDLGAQIGQGVQLAFASQLQNAKSRLIAEVNDYASDQVTKLSSRFSAEYDKLQKENADLIAQIQEVQTFVAALQGGKLDAGTVLRQVSDSKLLNEKQKQQVGRAMEDVNKVLNPDEVLGRAGLPGNLSGALPGLIPTAPIGGGTGRPAAASPVLPGRLPGFGGLVPRPAAPRQPAPAAPQGR